MKKIGYIREGNVQELIWLRMMRFFWSGRRVGIGLSITLQNKKSAGALVAIKGNRGSKSALLQID